VINNTKHTTSGNALAGRWHPDGSTVLQLFYFTCTRQDIPNCC